MVRIKYRYLLVNVLYPAPTPTSSKSEPQVPHIVQFRQPSSDRFDVKVLVRIIRDGVSELFGDYGAGMIGPSLQVKYFSPATSTAIIRVARQHYRLVWAALTFCTRLPKPVDQPCVMQVVRVSGTIKKAEEEAIKRARLSIRRAERAVGRGSDAKSGRIAAPQSSAGVAAVGAVGGAERMLIDEDDVGMGEGIEDFGEEDEGED